MSDAIEVFAYAREISDTVARAVGAVGSRQEVISLPGEEFEAVRFSRGGVLVPSHSRWPNRNAARDANEDPASVEASVRGRSHTIPAPNSYNPHLTVIRHNICLPGMIGGPFDKKRSGSYIFDLASRDIPSPGVFIKTLEVEANELTDVPTFYMLGAEVLADPGRLEFVHGLCERFKQATERRIQQALNRQD